MSCSQINIIPTNYEVVLVDSDRTITIIDNNCCTTVNITQPETSVVKIYTGHPGTQGPIGPQGPTGSSAPFTQKGGDVWFTTSSIEITGSFTVSGSNTFKNIGPAIFSGSISTSGSVFIDGNLTITGTASFYSSSIVYSSGSTKFGDTLDDTHQFTGSILMTGSLRAPAITGSFTGSLTGIATTASYIVLAQTSSLSLGGSGSFTGSFLGTSSFSQQTITASYLNPLTQSILFSGSFNQTGSLSVTGSINKILIKRANNIYTLGDSLTAAGLYQNQITASLGSAWDIVNFGIPGNTTVDITNRLDSVINGDSNTVIVWAGINDIVQGNSLELITGSLQNIYTLIKNSGSNVVALTISPFSGSVNWTSGKQAVWNGVNNWILNTAINVDYKIDLIPKLEFPSGSLMISSSYNSGDFLHLNATGYSVVGNTICQSSSYFLYSSSLEERIGKNLIINQNLSTISDVVFKNIILTQNVKTYGSGSFTGNITASDIFANNGNYLGNMNITGVITTMNSFALGSPGGVSGSITTGGGQLKIMGGVSSSNITFSTPLSSNGRLTVKNATGNVLIGDVASIIDNITGSLQVFGTSSLQVVDIKHSTAELNFWPQTSANSAINFRQTTGTIRGLININISSGEMKFWGQSGGYFVTIGANGSEAVRVNTSQNTGFGTAANINARVHISSSTEQLRIASTTSSYWSTLISNTGNISFFITGSNTNPSFNFTGSTIISSSVLITGSLRMHYSSSLELPLTASYFTPFTGSIYYSGSFLFVWNGTRYMSASLA